MDRIYELIQQMRISRGWDKTDTLPILIKSISAEAGELLETIQWNEEDINMEAVKGEVADILMYTLSICIDNGLDVEQLIRDKIENVYERYPEIEND